MGALKKIQKAHKTGRHRSKREIRRVTGGKVDVKKLTTRAKAESSKQVRLNQAQQIRKAKRDGIVAKKRNFGSDLAAPILISVIPLNENIDINSIVSIFEKSEDSQTIVKKSSQGNIHISLKKWKKRFCLVTPSPDNIFEILDVIKVSSIVLFVLNDDIDDWGENILKSCIPQQLPTTMVVFSNTDKHSNVKQQNQNIRKKVKEAITKFLPDPNIRALNNTMDATNLLRIISEQKETPIHYRDCRPHLIAEKVEYIPCEKDNLTGTLKVTGYIRGKALSANNLVHIPEFGDYQLVQIDAPIDPFPIDPLRDVDNDDIKILEIADPKNQESLQDENIPEPMDCEQTWPTAEELAEAKAAKQNKIIKRVPKGTSAYQAAWIPDDGDELDDDKYSENDDDQNMAVEQSDFDNEADNSKEDDEEYETITISEAPIDEHRYDEQIDIREELQAIDILKKANLDAKFPDEVDTPQDTLAKIRFQKYRGLDSFRTSPWDPKENLPFDYSRIFEFENYRNTKKRVFRDAEEVIGAEPGWYVTLHIKNVDKELYDAYRAISPRPLVVFGLLQYEHKMSVLNVTLQRTNDSGDQPIASKEKLLFQCGFRRFTACPLFSEHISGSKHKYLRFFQPQVTAVATMYAPISFSPCPVLCYKQHKNGELELIAKGNVLSVDPNRLIIKRVVLSGHPFKVYKRSAVIRFMFFNREDIEWFKPIELYTKYGRRGYIKEPLGTHGHMKCIFKGQLKSQDTVLMNLYKRVYPKWTYEPLSFYVENDE
ncbi:pre-rRNA-processing protein TSR1 homolog [Chelonus insularis]|uniref:pre-rRNA-processing protein TSR1 homolog n=1 Tax=Chelonus insularis TaxID=460826 RepID=UPI00158C1B06|nr:pre-rRNA-processing protein TSR1 homolog [Chelonus insularis]